MDYLKTILFLTVLRLLIIEGAFSYSDREKDFYFYRFFSKKLSNSSPVARQQSKEVQKKMDCIWTCLDVFWCRSINIKKVPLSSGLLECQLLSFAWSTSGVVMSNDSNYDHYNKGVSTCFL